jgi:hypothetical protein
VSIDLTERRIAELARMVENEECPSDGMTLLAVDIALSDAPALITLLRIRQRSRTRYVVLRDERDALREALANISPGTLAVVDRNLRVNAAHAQVLEDHAEIFEKLANEDDK